MRQLFVYIFLILLQLALFSEEPFFQEEWKNEDSLIFNATMEKLAPFFADHVTQHAVDDAYLIKARDRFITLLDPNKVYLLESEIEPYCNSIQPFRAAWDTHSLRPFWNLFAAQVYAVERAQSMRSSLMSCRKSTSFPSYEESFFAQDDDDLLIRQTALLISYMEPIDSFQQAEKRLEAKEEEWTQTRKHFSKACSLFHRVLLSALSYAFDPHSHILDKKEADDLKKELTKTTYGTGIEVHATARGIVVRRILKGSPADSANTLQVGDRILSLNKVPVSKMALSDIQAILETKQGSRDVFLKYETSDAVKKFCTIEKQTFSLDEGRVSWSVRRTIHGDILVIRLDCFYRGANRLSAENDFRSAWQQACAQYDIKGLVFDLRKNRGGFLLEAVTIAGLFIKSGVIVVVEYADGSKRSFRDLDPDVLISCPVVVLTSKETASAAEIVAQAVKDYGVGVVVGDEHTFGKGTVQSETVTTNTHASSQYKVTIGTYYSVAGQSIQGEGVKADILVQGDQGSGVLGEEFLEGSLPKTCSIEPSFQDTLSDVASSSLSWYRTYYVPFLESPKKRWAKCMPELQKRSFTRVEGKKLPSKEQLNEAILIVQDMISLEKVTNSKEEVAGNYKKK